MSEATTRRGRGQGALFYKPDRGRWIGRVEVDGERREVSALTKTEARRLLDEMRRSADAGLPIPSGTMTVASLLQEWFDKALPNRNPSESGVAGHAWAIKILVDEIGSKRVRTLTPDDVEAAFRRRTERVEVPKQKGRGRTVGSPLSRSSLIKIRSTLHQALTWAQRRNIVARNIAALVEIPSSAAPARSGKSLDVTQAELLLQAARGTDLEAMWTAMLYLGLRPGEAAGLAWSDVDEEAGTVHVWRARKSRRSGAAQVGDTKTPGSVRTLDAPESVLNAFRRHRTRQVEQQLAAGQVWSNPDGLIFTSPTGRPTDPKAVRNEFDRIIAGSTIEGHWTPNLLRHSAASLMADADMPIQRVADQLGHRDLRMLQKHYRHRVKPTINGGHVVDAALSRHRS